jgi:hypothetical protein
LTGRRLSGGAGVQPGLNVGLVVVDLKTVARKYSDLQVEASLQLSIYSYATAMNGLADEDRLRLRFDVLTKTKPPSSTATGPPGIAPPTSASTGSPPRSSPPSTAGVFPPRVGWHCQDCPVGPERLLGVGMSPTGRSDLRSAGLDSPGRPG